MGLRSRNFLLAFGALAAVVFATPAARAAAPKLVYFIFTGYAYPYFAPMAAAVKEAGIFIPDLKIRIVNANNSAAQEIADLKEAVAAGAEGIILNTIQESVTAAALEAAHPGVAIVTVDRDVSSPAARIAFIGDNDFTLGQELTQYGIQVLTDRHVAMPWHVVVLQGTLGASVTIGRQNGTMSVLEPLVKSGAAKIVLNQSVNFATATAQSMMGALFASHRAMQSRATAVLDTLNTKIRPNNIVAELSGGEQQVVAIARALLFERSMVIMDEPTAAISVQKVADVLDIIRRLPLIFPEGTPNRTYCVRELAASTVFAALYIGAVEGTGRFLGPVHVYRMTREQAERSSRADREGYAQQVRRKKAAIPGTRWYADNTRDPIRDETLRDGLVAIGAVLRRNDLPTTSRQPRYALKAEFAALFDPVLEGEALAAAIRDFQARQLSKSALTRISIVRAGAAAASAGVFVTFPNQETRQLAPDPSAVISRAVIETFATRYLEQPAVLWLSESNNKVVLRDDQIAKGIGLNVEPDKNLPDIILAGLGPTEPLIVFVEVVATDGAITPRRQAAMHAIPDAAGFKRSQIAFSLPWRSRLPAQILG